MGPTELIERIESAAPSKALDRQIALAVGWHRYSPSETGRKYPGWIAPEDFIGEYVGADGRRTPKLDSLHGTEIRRDPRPYSTSIDAAMTLVPDGLEWELFGYDAKRDPRYGRFQARIKLLRYEDDPEELGPQGIADASTPALALCGAALKAMAPQ